MYCLERLYFSLHILVIDHFSPKVDGVKMSCIQFLVCGVVSLIPMFLLETPSLKGVLGGLVPNSLRISSGVGYTLQIVAQKNMNPAIASNLKYGILFCGTGRLADTGRTIVCKSEGCV